ncbi:MAG: UvrD-helicase domain-containing protein [Pseudomonadota bacterium]
MSQAPRVPADAAARQAILEDLDHSLFVEAAAGTGKTTALVGRMVALIRSGRAQLDTLVALTFTDKAAGEMKLRLRAALERQLRDPQTPSEQAERLRDALSQLELAAITTIHAFCNDLLRERPVEAQVDPLFEIAASDEEAMIARAFDDWFERAVADPPPGVRRVLRREATSVMADNGPRQQLFAAARALIDTRDFDAPWAREVFDRDAQIDALMTQANDVAALAALSSWPDDYLTQSLRNLDRELAEIRQREQAAQGERDYDGLEAKLRALARPKPVSWHWKGSKRTQYGELDRDTVLERRNALKEALDRFKAACEADLAPQLQQELRAVVEAYEKQKASVGKLDFLDLLIRTRDLLVRDSTVRNLLQQRYSHFFVDEFQDTDPLQAEILLLLAADDRQEEDWTAVRGVPGKLFIVGDPKQSIYRFRRADIAIYEGIKQQLTQAGARVLHLNTSFRSRPAIQRFVNAAFNRAMTGEQQARYEALAPWREEQTAQPAVVALPVPRPYGDYGTVVNFRVDDSLPEAVAAYIQWLVEESGWTVEEGGESVPLRPRHVCVLFRRFKTFNRDVTRPYVRALEARRIPHMLVGGRSFHDREEVLALRNALTAIEWPDDELRVYATLRGPLFAFSDEALLAFRFTAQADGSIARRPLNPLVRFEGDDGELAAELSEDDRQIIEALTLLRELHFRRNRRPLAETVTRLLRAVRAHAGIAIWPTGEQALANVLRTVDLARRHEARGAISFRSFVEQLERDAQAREAEEATVVEEGTEGVRIMNTHKAKGLEFPVVILADPTCSRVSERPSRHVDASKRLWAQRLCDCVPPDLAAVAEQELAREEEESVRLVYVAATRARDLLVVPAIGDDPLAGWLDVLHPAVYPNREARQLAVVANGCPPFGSDTVLERPPNARTQVAAVIPGQHRTADGEAEVVWWDPGLLALEAPREVGLRQQRILEVDEAGQAEASEAHHRRWQEDRQAVLAQGAQASCRVRTATALAADGAKAQDDSTHAVEVLSVEAIDPARPGGRRFGTLVHAVLATAELTADESALEAVAKVQGRLLGASDEEVTAAIATCVQALTHPLVREAADALARGDCYREWPVTARATQDPSTLVEGVIDLVFRDATGAWCVVDFKTDREVSELADRYALQLHAYATALAQALGSTPGRLVLLRV